MKREVIWRDNPMYSTSLTLTLTPNPHTTQKFVTVITSDPDHHFNISTSVTSLYIKKSMGPSVDLLSAQLSVSFVSDL